MIDYFSKIDEIKFEGKSSNNPLSFKFYDENKIVLGKTMKEHLRFAACYWHTFNWPGLDPFGGPTFDRPWMKSGDALKMAELKLDIAFDFFSKIKTPFFCFHDRDIAPEGSTYKETQKNFFHIIDLMEKKMELTNMQLLWGTANATARGAGLLCREAWLSCAHAYGGCKEGLPQCGCFLFGKCARPGSTGLRCGCKNFGGARLQSYRSDVEPSAAGPHTHPQLHYGWFLEAAYAGVGGTYPGSLRDDGRGDAG